MTVASTVLWIPMSGNYACLLSKTFPCHPAQISINSLLDLHSRRSAI